MPATLRTRAETHEEPATQNTDAFSASEAIRLFDATARLYTGLSGEDFLHAWDCGRFTDPESKMRAMRVAILIPLVRKTSARKPTR
jgi:hypothetical protein